MYTIELLLLSCVVKFKYRVRRNHQNNRECWVLNTLKLLCDIHAISHHKSLSLAGVCNCGTPVECQSWNNNWIRVPLRFCRSSKPWHPRSANLKSRNLSCTIRNWSRIWRFRQGLLRKSAWLTMGDFFCIGPRQKSCICDIFKEISVGRLRYEVRVLSRSVHHFN